MGIGSGDRLPSNSLADLSTVPYIMSCYIPPTVLATKPARYNSYHVSPCKFMLAGALNHTPLPGNFAFGITEMFWKYLFLYRCLS